MSRAYCTFDIAVGNDPRCAMLSTGAEALLLMRKRRSGSSSGNPRRWASETPVGVDRSLVPI